MISKVTHWNILDTESLSDHRYISFGLFDTIKHKTRKLTMAGEARLRDIIKNDEWLNNTVFINFSPLQIENTLNIFYTHFSKWVKNVNEMLKIKDK